MENTTLNLWKDWRLHAVVFAIVIITELIGTHQFQIGPGTVLLLPMLYAVVIGLATFFTPLISKVQSSKAESLAFLFLILDIREKYFSVKGKPIKILMYKPVTDVSKLLAPE